MEIMIISEIAALFKTTDVETHAPDANFVTPGPGVYTRPKIQYTELWALSKAYETEKGKPNKHFPHAACIGT